MANSVLIFDFNLSSDLEAWKIVDDGVMGGISQGYIELNENGHCRYFGTISLENYGGFSSLRYDFLKKNIAGFNTVHLRIKGDGGVFQFRIKESTSDYYSYIYEFDTNGEWQDIRFPLDKMYPSFRGRKLDLPNFSADSIEGITILKGDKKNESFEILIDKIEIE